MLAFPRSKRSRADIVESAGDSEQICYNEVEHSLKVAQFRFNDDDVPNSLDDLYEYRAFLNRLSKITYDTDYTSMRHANELADRNSTGSEDSGSGDDAQVDDGSRDAPPSPPRHTSALGGSRGRSLASMRANRYPSAAEERAEQSTFPLDARRNLAMMSASPNPSRLPRDSAEALGFAAGALPSSPPASPIGAPSSPPASPVGALGSQFPCPRGPPSSPPVFPFGAPISPPSPPVGARAKQLPPSAGARARFLRSSLNECGDQRSGGAGDGEEEEGNCGPSAALSTPAPPSASKRVEPRSRAVKGVRSADPGSSAKGATSAQKVSTTFIPRSGLHERRLTHARPVAQSRQNSRAGGKRGSVERGDDSPSPPKKSHKLEGSAKNSISAKEMRALGLDALYSTNGLPPSAVKNFQARFAQMGEH